MRRSPLSPTGDRLVPVLAAFPRWPVWPGWRRALHVATSGLAALTLGLSVTACGGGGGGDGGGGSGGGSGGDAPLAADAGAWWVAGEGATWHYRLSDQRPGASAPQLKTVTDEGERVVEGRTVRAFRHTRSLYGTEPLTDLRWYEGGRVRALQVQDLDLTGSGSGSFVDELPAPLRAGTTRLLERSALADLDDDGRPDNLRYTVDATVGIEPALQVPAGRFTNTLRVRQVLTLVATRATGGEFLRREQVQTTWYAAGVGPVRRIHEDPDHVAPANTVTEELVGLDAGGLRAGLLSDLKVLGTTAGAETPGLVDGPRLVVGDQRMLVTVAGADGALEGALLSRDGRVQWQGRLLQPAAGEVVTRATATWDGSRFRIAALVQRPDALPTRVQRVLAQRLSPQGVREDGEAGAALALPGADLGLAWSRLRLVSPVAGEAWLLWQEEDPATVTVPGGSYEIGAVVRARRFDAAGAGQGEVLRLGEGRLEDALAWRDAALVAVSGPREKQDLRSLRLTRGAVAGLSVAVPRELATAEGLQRDGARFVVADARPWLYWRERGGDLPVGGLRRTALDDTGARTEGTPFQTAGLWWSGMDHALGDLAVAGERAVFVWRDGLAAVRGQALSTATLTAATAPALPAGEAWYVPRVEAAVASRTALQAWAHADALGAVWLESGGGLPPGVRLSVQLPALAR